MTVPKAFMQAFITVVLLLYFGLAMFGSALGLAPPSEPFAQTLIAVFMIAIGYYLGTSQSSAKKDEVIAEKL